MRTFLGMILGALLLVAGVYVYDSMSTSTVANGQVAQANRTIVNWDVAATDWNALKRAPMTTGSGCRRNNRTHEIKRPRPRRGRFMFDAAICLAAAFRASAMA